MAVNALKNYDNSNLESVKVQHNNFKSPDQLMPFLASLPKNVRSLYLGYNKISCKGIEQVGKIMLDYKKFSNLRLLNLENTSLSDNGAAALFPFLYYHQSLNILDLSLNNISDLSAECVGKLISQGSSL